MEIGDKHRCYNCGKQFKDETHLDRHKKRKTPCLIREIKPEDRNNPLRCIYCNKVFSKVNNLNRHRGICKVKNGGLQTLHDKVKHEEELRIQMEEQKLLYVEIDQKNKDLFAIVSQMREEIDILKTQNKELKAGVQGDQIVGGAVNNNGIINNNNNTTNNTINVQLTINNYNKPNLDYIKNDVAKFEKLLKYEMAATPIAVVEWVWYNPEHPENVSAHLVNKKTGEVLVSLDGKWVTDNVSNIIPKLRQIAYEFTQFMISSHKDLLITFATDHVPAILARNLNDERVMKMDEDDIMQKMITGRDISQNAVSGKLLIQ
jgi:hypothetical protein